MFCLFVLCQGHPSELHSFSYNLSGNPLGLKFFFERNIAALLSASSLEKFDLQRTSGLEDAFGSHLSFFRDSRILLHCYRS